jgi:hypothetical protein
MDAIQHLTLEIDKVLYAIEHASTNEQRKELQKTLQRLQRLKEQNYAIASVERGSSSAGWLLDYVLGPTFREVCGAITDACCYILFGNEQENAARATFLRGDVSGIFEIGFIYFCFEGVMWILSTFGYVPSMYARGTCAALALLLLIPLGTGENQAGYSWIERNLSREERHTAKREAATAKTAKIESEQQSYRKSHAKKCAKRKLKRQQIQRKMVQLCNANDKEEKELLEEEEQETREAEEHETRKREEQGIREAEEQQIRQAKHPTAHTAETNTQPPNEYQCPITMELMCNPVIATDGYTYEREAIEAWFARGGVSALSPKTNEPLLDRVLTPNRSMRALILDWKNDQLRQEQPGEEEGAAFVRKWLMSALGIKEGQARAYATAMVEEGFDSLDVLQDLVEADLVRFGVMRGHIKAILRHAAALPGARSCIS